MYEAAQRDATGRPRSQYSPQERDLAEKYVEDSRRTNQNAGVCAIQKLAVQWRFRTRFVSAINQRPISSAPPQKCTIVFARARRICFPVQETLKNEAKKKAHLNNGKFRVAPFFEIWLWISIAHNRYARFLCTNMRANVGCRQSACSALYSKRSQAHPDGSAKYMPAGVRLVETSAGGCASSMIGVLRLLTRANCVRRQRVCHFAQSPYLSLKGRSLQALAGSRSQIVGREYPGLNSGVVFWEDRNV